MGTTTNDSNQEIVRSFKEALTSLKQNSVSYKVLNPGVYDGFEITKVNDSTVQISTGTLVIEDPTNNVVLKLRTQSAVNRGVSTSDVYVYCHWEYNNSKEGNYVEILTGPLVNVASSDVILGKVIYTSTTITSIDYSFRSFGNLKDEIINIDPETQSGFIWINASTNFWYISNDGYSINYVNEKVKKNSVALSGSAGYYYLCYNGTAYSQQTEASITPVYSYARNGWYSSSYRVLARFYWTGSAVTTSKIFIYKNEPQYVTDVTTLGGSSPSDSKTPTELAIKTFLESHGFADSLTTKNISGTGFDWQTIDTYGTGLYYLSGGTQSNSPDGTTSNSWYITVNCKGAAGSTDCSVSALRADNGFVYLNYEISGTWGTWEGSSVYSKTNAGIALWSTANKMLTTSSGITATNTDLTIASGSIYSVNSRIDNRYLLQGAVNSRTYSLQGTLAAGSQMQIIQDSVFSRFSSNESRSVTYYDIKELYTDHTGTVHFLGNCIYLVDGHSLSVAHSSESFYPSAVGGFAYGYVLTTTDTSGIFKVNRGYSQTMSLKYIIEIKILSRTYTSYSGNIFYSY